MSVKFPLDSYGNHQPKIKWASEPNVYYPTRPYKATVTCQECHHTVVGNFARPQWGKRFQGQWNIHVTAYKVMAQVTGPRTTYLFSTTYATYTSEWYLGNITNSEFLNSGIKNPYYWSHQYPTWAAWISFCREERNFWSFTNPWVVIRSTKNGDYPFRLVSTHQDSEIAQLNAWNRAYRSGKPISQRLELGGITLPGANVHAAVTALALAAQNGGNTTYLRNLLQDIQEARKYMDVLEVLETDVAAQLLGPLGKGGHHG